jgi:hypothetical protein
MARELINLERTPSQAGKNRVTHPKHKRDDHANSLALAAAIASRGPAGRSQAGEPRVIEHSPRATEPLAKSSRWDRIMQQRADRDWADPSEIHARRRPREIAIRVGDGNEKSVWRAGLIGGSALISLGLSTEGEGFFLQLTGGQQSSALSKGQRS